MDAHDTVTNYFDSLVAGDAPRLIEVMSSANHFVKIGTDVGEFLEGNETAADYYKHLVASAADFTIALEHLDVQERGDVAWFYTRQVWNLKWQGIFEALAMRMTGVLEKEKGSWRFVQIHASVGCTPG